MCGTHIPLRGHVGGRSPHISPHIGPGLCITPKKSYVRGDSIYAVSLKYKKTTVQFRDSYLLLKASLSNLTSDFETCVVKGVFPHYFMNCERLEYTGPKPGIEFYKDIPAEDYAAIPPRGKSERRMY